MADQNKNKIKTIKVDKPNMNPDRSWKVNADVTSVSWDKTKQGWKNGMKNNAESLNPVSMVKSVVGGDDSHPADGGSGGGGDGGAVTTEKAAPESKVKLIKVTPPTLTSTAIQHTSKHFDIVLAIDIHWTLIPPPPSFMLIPLPLPHPFIGIVFDIMDYIKFTIPIPQFIRNMKPDLPEGIPMGGSIYVHGRHKATTTTSVMGVIIPFKHVTSLIPVYMIPFLQEAPHEGEVYYGSQTVLAQGSKMSGNQPQQVLTCMGFPFGMTMLPAMPNKPKKNPLAYFAFYNNFSSMYIQINTGGPVLVGGAFIPHVYTPGEMLMRFAGMFLMRSLTKQIGKGITKFNHFLQGKFGKTNPVSKALCKVGLEPVNFATGAMLFEWDDFKIEGSTPLSWENAWYSDRPYKNGILGNGIFNNHDLYIVPDEDDKIAAWIHPDELQPMAVPFPEVGEEPTYYRSQKIWQYRPDNRTWIIRKGTDVYTYQRFHHSTEGTIFKIVYIEYGDGTIREYEYQDRNIALKSIKDVKSGFHIETVLHPELKKISEVYYCYKNQRDLQVRYDYDERGNLTHVWDIHKKAIAFEYDGENRMIRRTNRNGMAYHWEYDEKSRVVHTKGLDGFMEGRLRYDEEEGYTEVIYPRQNNKTEQYFYEEDYLVYKKVDGEGGETWYDYTSYNELKMIGTPEGRVQGYTYDDMGNIAISHHPDGEEYQYQYNEFGQIIARFSPSGASETWSYDEEGKLISYTDPSEETVIYEYPQGERLPEKSRRKDVITQYEYNQRGQIIRLMNTVGAEQYWRYDEYGRVLIFSPKPLNRTLWNRDRMGRVVELNEQGQLPLKFRYDAYDLPVYATDGRSEWLMSYTPMGSLKRQVRRNSLTYKKEETLAFGYNAYENLMSITNEKGEVYQFERNNNDEVVGETGFDGQKKFFVRDKDGFVTQRRTPQGKNIFYEYDLGGRLTQAHYPDGTWEAYQYDTSGLLIKADNENSSIAFQRNKLGQVTGEKQGEHLIQYEYDSQGNLIGLQSSLGAEIDYSYNDLGQLKNMTAVTRDVHLPWQMNLDISNNGQIQSREMTGGIESTFEFDHIGMPVSQKVTVQKTTAFHKDYHWTSESQLLQVLDRITGGRTKFDYDAFGSLVAAEYSNGEIQYKNPDETGCVYESAKRNDRVYDKGGKLMRDKSWFYHYDDEGNLLLKSKRPINNVKPEHQEEQNNSHPYYKNIASDWLSVPKLPDATVLPNVNEDSSEEILRLEWESGDWAYSWSGNGMLANVKRPDGKVVNFEYDALGRRTSKIGAKKITRYIWDGNNLLHEWSYDIEENPVTVVDDDGNIITGKEPVENLVTWVYEKNTFVPCAKIINDESYSIISDYIGRPIQSYDKDGQVIWSSEYDIYGNLKNVKGDKNFIPFRQLGQYEDSELDGLYFNRFRYYDAESGRYISKDPIGLKGGLSHYTYVYDPNNWVDIFGLNKDELVYQLVNSDGEVVYYGITNRTDRERLLEHLRSENKKGQFSHMEVLAEGLDHGDARSIEGALIRKRMNERLNLMDRMNLSVEDQLSKAGLLNLNRGRLEERWTAKNPLDNFKEDMLETPRKVEKYK
ncbi:type IV secretion protein Rhs [Chryseobacterium lactis]|uniref:Type IV secretion protein Rhs n=1 Tax=Chryseobacterium lactis TaxID=1241981 RepID=A0A3G6RHI7_CHRLC|nr:RHS repeat-associated core domain-containing protein [Chryseobacterium lactis]AZA83263.1 type IV secretion protein Rhs [Chryseobacterium lactis]AZB03648.1 type IV secretion protein Rhs [Chryseobacterium lactis]PNW11142.1 type IV secretion protein Rhs [Chryseobacterium lactis]